MRDSPVLDDSQNCLETHETSPLLFFGHSWLPELRFSLLFSTSRGPRTGPTPQAGFPPPVLGCYGPERMGNAEWGIEFIPNSAFHIPNHTPRRGRTGQYRRGEPRLRGRPRPAAVHVMIMARLIVTLPQSKSKSEIGGNLHGKPRHTIDSSPGTPSTRARGVFFPKILFIVMYTRNPPRSA